MDSIIVENQLVFVNIYKTGLVRFYQFSENQSV
jgi:hypothetical protein